MKKATLVGGSSVLEFGVVFPDHGDHRGPRQARFWLDGVGSRAMAAITAISRHTYLVKGENTGQPAHALADAFYGCRPFRVQPVNLWLAISC